MSRISRYQDSINKYMKNKSCLTNLDNKNIKENIYNIIDDCDYLIPIVLLTVLSCQSRKTKISLHGYYMGCGIELMMTIAKIMDSENKYNIQYEKKNIKQVINKMSLLINMCLSQNIEHIQTYVSKEKVLKIFHGSIKYLNEKIYDIVDDINLEVGNNIKKTDLIKYNFETVADPKQKITALKQVNKDQLMNFIDKKYGSVCQTALVVGWLLGSGDDKMIDNLERLGTHLGNIIKLSYDFKNLEDDLNTSIDYTKNFVINYGIQESFELFIDSKAKFIEGCMKMDLYSNTMKEVLDLIEVRVDEIINKSSLDLKSHYTLT
jgi:hypothetical protein